MDQHTLQILEFHKICQLVGQKALSPLGRESALAIAPMTDREAISVSLQQTTELKEIIQGGADFPLQRFEDVRISLARCQHQGSVLDPEDLLHISHILYLCRELIRFAEDRSGSYPHLEALIRQVKPLADVKKKIDDRIDEKGQIRDGASRKLGNLREESVATRDRILAKLRSLLSSLAGKRIIKEEVITLRDGRYVIPVSGDQRHRVQGVVHDRSASGATLFVEPSAILDLGNRLREIELEEKREILRILRNLTREVAERAPTIVSNMVILQKLDLIQAKARFSIELQAAHPQISEDGVLRLKGGRHPLLMLLGGEAEEVVPLDVELGDRYHTLVVTGPNTGGKTVVLKTLGLFSLMVQAGLHIPAHGDSQLPMYKKIYADIGDEQSLEQSLSTFSSHLRNIVKVLEHADQDTLVLLDEIGVGTDPEEGTALAMAVLETLTERGARTVATTHFGALKVFAHDRDGIENASLEFDRQTLRPTYRFQVGIPGSSYALEIANRLGMQPAVLKRATDILGPETKETAQLIEDLKERVAFYQQKNSQLRAQEEELHRLTEDYRKKLQDVHQEEGRIREKAYRDAEVVLAEANATVERVIAQIRKSQASKATIKEAHRVLDVQATRVKKRLQSIAPKEPSSALCLQKGDPVWVQGLEAEGEVVARLGRGARYKIQVGHLVMEVDGAELRPLSKPAVSKSRSGHAAEDGQFLAEGASDEIDLRGLTADEAIAKLEKYIDRAILAGLNTLWVIHGKGTGVLRRRVGDFLKDFPGVKSYRLGAWNEGGDGVTVVELQ